MVSGSTLSRRMAIRRAPAPECSRSTEKWSQMARSNSFWVFVESSARFWGLMLEKAVHGIGILHYGWLGIWHQRWMARAAKRSRRLWDTYSFSGFRPEQTVRGIFGDPSARIITLMRRSKKRLVVVAVIFRWGGTTARSGACAIFPAATRGYFWKWRCGGSSAAVVAR